jgi:hypothetical protein
MPGTYPLHPNECARFGDVRAVCVRGADAPYALKQTNRESAGASGFFW